MTKGNLRRELIFDFFCQLRSLKRRFFDFDFDLLILQKPTNLGSSDDASAANRRSRAEGHPFILKEQ